MSIVRVACLVLLLAILGLATSATAERSALRAKGQRTLLSQRRTGSQNELKWWDPAKDARDLAKKVRDDINRARIAANREAKRVKDEIEKQQRMAEEGAKAAEKAFRENEHVKKVQEEATKASQEARRIIDSNKEAKRIRDEIEAKAAQAKRELHEKANEEGAKVLKKTTDAANDVKNTVVDTVDNTKKGIEDTVNTVKNEVEKNDIYQALAGSSPAKTAILNVVECISTDGAPIKKDADPIKTVERLAKNVEDLMKKMNKDMKRDLGAVIKHEFGDGFAKQKKDIDQLFVKLNDPKGLGLSDETAECKPDDKAVCGNTKCGKMLSSSTGFACCSDSFDYGGKPHCSHDAKLWNKLFTADRKVDPEVAKMLAKMAVSEGERQIADLQKSDSLEAEFKCMLKHILVPALPSLEAYLAQMLTKAIQEMTDLSDQFFGGDKLEKFVHKTLSSLFGGAVKLASAGKELKKIRDTVTGVANGFCEKTMATAATVGKNLKNARDSPSVRGPVCALKKTITEGKVGDVLRLAGPPMVDEALDWLHMKFLAPIEQDLANKLMSVWGTVLDFVVGLAGLIPEVGGIISDAIVVPLTYLSNTLVNPLVNMLQGEVWKKAKDAIMKVATKMLDSIIPHIEKLAEDGANALAGGTKAAKGAIGKVDQFVTENQGIITNLFVPVFQQICAAVFPKVPAIVTKCYKATNDVLELAGAADGFCEGKAGTDGTMGDKIGKVVDDVKTEVKKNVKKVEDSDIGKAVIGAGEAVNDANKKTNEKLAELKAGAKATVKAAKEKVATLKAEVKNNVGEMKVAAKAKLAEAKTKVTAAKADMKAKLSGLFK